MTKGKHKHAVNFPRDVYDKIKRRAKKSGRSFSDEAIDLIKCGIFDIEESESYDPPEERVND